MRLCSLRFSRADITVWVCMCVCVCRVVCMCVGALFLAFKMRLLRQKGKLKNENLIMDAMISVAVDGGTYAFRISFLSSDFNHCYASHNFNEIQRQFRSRINVERCFCGFRCQTAKIELIGRSFIFQLHFTFSLDFNRAQF